MNKKDKIVKILLQELRDVYCYNCVFDNMDSYECEECHRKYMNWSLSPETAAYIANKIIEELDN